MKLRIHRYAAVAALAAGMAFAQAPATAPNARPAGRQSFHKAARQRLMQELNLTDAQKQQAKTIWQDARQNAKPLMQQMRQNHEALAAAVKANDTAQIQQLSTQQGTLRGQMVAIRSAAMAKFYNILTPDQRAKADQIHARMQQRFRERFQQRHNG